MFFNEIIKEEINSKIIARIFTRKISNFTYLKWQPRSKTNLPALKI